MKTKIPIEIITWLLLVLLIGVLLGRHLPRPWEAEDQREQEKLRHQLEIEKKNVVELRRGFALERELFKIQIDKSLARYDSIDSLHIARERGLQRTINRLRKSTVKDLENEADSIYRNRPDN